MEKYLKTFCFNIICDIFFIGEKNMKKLLTIILDGFGMREDIYGNAVKNAGMTNFINIWNKYPHCLLKASSSTVNLPKDQCGFSEYGHKLIGCGRKIRSRLSIADDAFYKGTINNSKKIKEMIEHLKMTNKNIHLITIRTFDRYFTRIYCIFNISIETWTMYYTTAI